MKPKKKINIVIIEDNRLLRDGLSSMINEQKDLKVVASISEGEKSLSRIIKLKPNIVLIDLGLRTENSLRVVKSIKENSSDINIIVMDLLPIQSDVMDFVKAGASGFILKDAMVKEFLKTIRSVASGEKILPPNMAGSLFTEIIERAINGAKKPVDLIDAVRMTKREKEVTELIADGLTNKEIGHILHLSPYTVKSHVHNILEKMALHTRLQIAKYAYSNSEIKNNNDTISPKNN